MLFSSICLYILLIHYKISVSCYEIEAISDPEDGILESPQWSPEEQALYWVNTLKQKWLRYDAKTGNITSRYIYSGPTSFIIPVKDNPSYVVGSVRSSIYLLKWGASDGDSALRLLTTVDRGMPDNTINDAKADAAGRLWFGTLGKLDFNLKTFASPDEGTLYSMDFKNFPDPVIKKRPVTVSNGIAFSLDNKKMYYIDSPTRRVVSFDYDVKKGKIANESVIFDFNDHEMPGIPDGMTIDAYGNLWVATFSSVILVIDPTDGQLLWQLELPVDHVTSMIWGGQNLNTLYVTTSRTGEKNPKQLSGSLFKITDLGLTGVPEPQFVFPDAAKY